MLRSIKRETGSPLLINPAAKSVQKRYVTTEQKQFLFDFISKNPEIVTHKSGLNSRKVLWKKLVYEINKIDQTKVERSSKYWCNYWYKWTEKLLTRPLQSWSNLDHQVNKFLTNVGYYKRKNLQPIQVNIESEKEILNQLKKLESEKIKLNIEYDEVSYKMLILKNQMKQIDLKIKEMDRTTYQNRKKIKQLIKNKSYLNSLLAKHTT